MAQSLQKKILNRLYDYEYQAFSLLTEEERELFVAINKNYCFLCWVKKAIPIK
jgi:hypothetical protein